MKLPKTISDYSNMNPLIPAVQMIRFQDGRNAGLKEATALIESGPRSDAELAEKIRSLLFNNGPEPT